MCLFFFLFSFSFSFLFFLIYLEFIIFIHQFTIICFSSYWFVLIRWCCNAFSITVRYWMYPSGAIMWPKPIQINFIYFAKRTRSHWPFFPFIRSDFEYTKILSIENALINFNLISFHNPPTRTANVTTSILMQSLYALIERKYFHLVYPLDDRLLYFRLAQLSEISICQMDSNECLASQC